MTTIQTIPIHLVPELGWLDRLRLRLGWLRAPHCRTCGLGMSARRALIGYKRDGTERWRWWWSCPREDHAPLTGYGNGLDANCIPPPPWACDVQLAEYAAGRPARCHHKSHPAVGLPS